MKLSLWPCSLGPPAMVNGKWGACPQEPVLRAASIALRCREPEGREGRKKWGKAEKDDERERREEKQRDRNNGN